MVPDILVISTKAWDKLTPDQQQAIQTAAKESTLMMKDLWSAAEQEELKAIDAMQVDKKPFQEAVQPMFDQLKKTDPDTYEVIEQIKLLGNN